MGRPGVGEGVGVGDSAAAPSLVVAVSLAAGVASVVAVGSVCAAAGPFDKAPPTAINTSIEKARRTRAIVKIFIQTH